jgi:hypothetical protein
MSFADLKKQSKLGSLTAKLVKEVEKMNNTGSDLLVMTANGNWSVTRAATVMPLSVSSLLLTARTCHS